MVEHNSQQLQILTVLEIAVCFFFNFLSRNLTEIVVFLSSVRNEKPVWYLLSLASATFHIQAVHAHSWHHAQCRSPPQVDTSHTAAPLFVLQIQDSALPITSTCTSKQMKASQCPRTFFEDVFEHSKHMQ